MFRGFAAAALLLSFMMLSSIAAADPALAHASRKARPNASQALLADHDALFAWCRRQILKRYGHPAPRNPKRLRMNRTQLFMKADACLRSEGWII